MQWKEQLVSQRARVAYWSPIVVLFLIGLLNVTPFASTDSILEIEGKVDEEYTRSVDFYPNEYVETQPFTEDYDDSGAFEGEISERLSYKNSGNYIGEIGEIGEDLSRRIAVMTTLSLFMLIVGFSCRNNCLLYTSPSPRD